MVLLCLGLAGSARADAPPPPRAPAPAIRVTRVRGPRTPAGVHARVRTARVADCQHTFIGGDLLADVEIDAAGALTVQRTHAGEEIRSYGRCVERALERLSFGPAAGVTRARLIVSFPSLGLDTPASP
ncbi:MAG: hypothetical protein H6719_20940 [Sandaracinaceae bacterium]|nr:hypothetical protein [Sandaracinaceae bacterium]